MAQLESTDCLPSDTSSSTTTSSDTISDVVSFSLCSLCAIKLNQLYPEQYHECFRSATLKRMIDHFKLPQKVLTSISEFTPEDEFTFLSSIKTNYQHGPFKLIEELVLLSVSSGSYDARSHYLIIEVAELLGIPRDLVEIHCESIYELLLHAQDHALEGADKIDPDSDRDREKRESRKKIKKYLMIGLASLGGGAVIGVTGGLAAPIVASAFAGVLGAGTIVMSSAAAGVVGSLFGVAGAGLTASKMQKRIGDLEEFAFQSLSPEFDQTSLTITIAISGWISDEGEQQFARPWKSLRNTKEQYCLCYESKYLLELSRAMDYLLSFVVSYATQEALKYTFLASVMASLAWPTALISIANIIDNPWDCCVGRSAEAGKHLADVLMSRQQGKRPASLIGFSLGARVIFFCLQELAQRKDSEGIIGDVVMLGAPVTASVDQWKPLGRVVSGRIINGYSSSDWLLKFLYRTSSAAIRVAGLQEIKWQDRRVKNVDLTPLVGGHMDYYKKLTEILDYVDVRTVVSFEDDLIVSSATTTTSGPLESSTAAMGATMATATTTPTSTNPLLTDSGIERTISNATNISSSLSEQSLTGTQATALEAATSGSDSGNLKTEPPCAWPSPTNLNSSHHNTPSLSSSSSGGAGLEASAAGSTGETREVAITMGANQWPQAQQQQQQQHNLQSAQQRRPQIRSSISSSVEAAAAAAAAAATAATNTNPATSGKRVDANPNKMAIYGCRRRPSSLSRTRRVAGGAYGTSFSGAGATIIWPDLRAPSVGGGKLFAPRHHRRSRSM